MFCVLLNISAKYNFTWRLHGKPCIYHGKSSQWIFTDLNIYTHFKPQNLFLKLPLKVQEFFHCKFLVKFWSKEVVCQCCVHWLECITSHCMVSVSHTNRCLWTYYVTNLKYINSLKYDCLIDRLSLGYILPYFINPLKTDNYCDNFHAEICSWSSLYN